MSDKNFLDENKLDELLRELYLEENSNTLNEAEASRVFSSNFTVETAPLKEQRLLNKLNKKKGGFWNFYGLVMVLALSFISLLSIFFYFRDKTVISHDESKQISNQQNINNTVDSNKLEKNTVQKFYKEQPFTIVIKSDTFARMRITEVPSSVQENPGNNTSATPENISGNKDANYKVPHLSVKEKERYLKIKEQMLVMLLKSDKDLYSFIPPAKTSFAGKSVAMDGFSIRNVAVTNLEYKTFLADLLVQNRNEDYFKAQVFPENWIGYGCRELVNTYFQTEKYNYFPVVNITIEGAKMFCQWLEYESSLKALQNNLKYKFFKMRLPLDEDWVYIARNGYARISYEEGYNTIYDLSEGLVDKTFSKRAETIKRRAKRVDTLYSVATTNKYKWTEDQLYDFFKAGTPFFDSPSIDTIDAQRMKILGKIGRVAEITMQRNSLHVWLTGQTWKSKEDYQQLENEFNSNLSSPFVGFRLVILKPDDPAYKNPFW